MNKTYDHRPNFDTDVQSFKNKQQFLVGISLYCYACCVVEPHPYPHPYPHPVPTFCQDPYFRQVSVITIVC